MLLSRCVRFSYSRYASLRAGGALKHSLHLSTKSSSDFCHATPTHDTTSASTATPAPVTTPTRESKDTPTSDPPPSDTQSIAVDSKQSKSPKQKMASQDPNTHQPRHHERSRSRRLSPKMAEYTSTALQRLREGMGGGSGGPLVLLGVETSCDDTGAAVVDERGRILGEAIDSQLREHQKTGGIVPRTAASLHKQRLEEVVSLALQRSGLSVSDMAGIAVTVGPGLKMCLYEGIRYVKKMATEYNKPVLPIHHMEAHALTPRLDKYIPFPYLVLLCSGGHCILAVVHSVREYHLLGQALDDSPGEALDKCARMMRLDLHPDVQGLSGGAAIERLAARGDWEKTDLKMKNDQIMHSRKCCNFSFAGVKEKIRIAANATKEMGWDEESPLPDSENLCAAVQKMVLDHLMTRAHRALIYCQLKRIPISAVVASGGVASNQTLLANLREVAQHYGFAFHAPPPKLCTDNGVMIAWAGMERLKAMEAGQEVRGAWLDDLGVCWGAKAAMLEPMPRLPMGRDLSEKVTAKRIGVKLNYKRHNPDDFIWFRRAAVTK